MDAIRLDHVWEKSGCRTVIQVKLRQQVPSPFQQSEDLWVGAVGIKHDLSRASSASWDIWLSGSSCRSKAWPFKSQQKRYRSSIGMLTCEICAFLVLLALFILNYVAVGQGAPAACPHHQTSPAGMFTRRFEIIGIDPRTLCTSHIFPWGSKTFPMVCRRV